MTVFTDPYQDSYPPSLWGGGGGPASAVVSINPATKAVGAAGFTMTITGTGFTSGSKVSFDSDPRTTTLVSPTQLTAPIGGITGVARTVQVTVSTGGSKPFIITATELADEEPESHQDAVLLPLPDEQEPE